MIEQPLLLLLSSPGLADDTTSQLRQEYQASQYLFQVQPALVQQYLGMQATALAEAIIRGVAQAHFTLPEHVTYTSTSETSWNRINIPPAQREQIIGGWLARLNHTDLGIALGQRLSELERSADQALSVSAILMRYTIAVHMIYHVLPSGRNVNYVLPGDDDIPNRPVERDTDRESTIHGRLDENATRFQSDVDRGDQQVPYVEAARRFYLPQWVAFDGQGQLLVNSVGEAEADIASMSNYLDILHLSLTIAPYMIADETWQQKRYCMLGQLVNQGRALARYQSQEIIQIIHRRVAEHRLDRGLRLSLPYFNDQTLAMEKYDFEVIPAGRIMFVPAFVVLAVQRQGAKVAQDISFSRSTRKHLLSQLSELEQAFLR